MATVQEELVLYGAKLVDHHLVAGPGGNISARDPQQMVWMKPRGFVMDDFAPQDLCGVHLTSGRQTKGVHKTPAEVLTHIAVYRSRSDVGAVFHVHPPWLSGIISSGAAFRPLTCEAILHLGRIATIPYVKPGTPEQAEEVGNAVCSADTLLLANDGMLAVGADVREAYHRCLVAEDAAKSIVAAALMGEPQYPSEEQIEAIRALGDQ